MIIYRTIVEYADLFISKILLFNIYSLHYIDILWLNVMFRLHRYLAHDSKSLHNIPNNSEQYQIN